VQRFARSRRAEIRYDQRLFEIAIHYQSLPLYFFIDRITVGLALPIAIAGVPARTPLNTPCLFGTWRRLPACLEVMSSEITKRDQGLQRLLRFA
jgi:hypothetical protein